MNKWNKKRKKYILKIDISFEFYPIKKSRTIFLKICIVWVINYYYYLIILNFFKIMRNSINNIIDSELNLLTLKFQNKDSENEYTKISSQNVSQSFIFQSFLLSIIMFSFFVVEFCLSQKVLNFCLKTGGLVIFFLLNWLIYRKKQNLIKPLTFIIKLILNVFLIDGLEVIESVLAQNEKVITSYVFLFIFVHFQKNLYKSASWFHSFLEKLFGNLYLILKLGKNNLNIENPFLIFFFFAFWVSTFNLYAKERFLRVRFQQERRQKNLNTKFSTSLIDIEPEISMVLRYRMDMLPKVKLNNNFSNPRVFSHWDNDESFYFPFDIKFLNDFAKTKELQSKNKLNTFMENIYLEDEENVNIKSYIKTQINFIDTKFTSYSSIILKKKCHEITKKEKYLLFISFNFWQSELFIILKFKTLIYEQEIEKLKTSLKNKDRLLATITHDLRTPLSGMLHFINQAKETKDVSELEKSLQYAQINGDLLMLLINDILDFSLLHENKMRLNIASFNLKNTIDEVIILLKPKAQFQYISLELEYKLNRLFSVRTDPSRLKQILINLIGNAIKFTKKGFVCLRVYKTTSKYIKFEVIDTGVGIDQDKIITLGDPYSSYNTEGLNNDGIGLGLNIVKQIISKLGPTNKLFISSKVGKGSKFCFTIYKSLEKEIKNLVDTFNKPIVFKSMTLEKSSKNITELSIEENMEKSFEFSEFDEFEEKYPIYSIEDMIDEETGISSISPQSSKNFFFEKLNSKKKSSFPIQDNDLMEKFQSLVEEKEDKYKFHILLVDDNMFNLLILETSLRKFKFLDISWETAFNGEIAIEKFRKNNTTEKNEKILPFNLIIMDSEMPIVNGFQAALKIKDLAENQNYFDCLIIGHSACNTDMEIRNCFDHGMNFFLMKPFTEKELVKVLYQCWKEFGTKK